MKPLRKTTDPDAKTKWKEPLCDEGQAAFEAFEAFRDLGSSRTIKKAWWLSKEEGQRGEPIPKGKLSGYCYWNEWSRANHWMDRARAYDISMAETRRLQKEEENAEIRKVEAEARINQRKKRVRDLEQQQWELSEKLFAVANAGLKHLSANPSKLTTRDVIQMFDFAQKLKEKTLSIADMTEMNAIATLVNSDLLPEEMVETFSEVWQGAADQTRERIGALFIPAQPQEA